MAVSLSGSNSIFVRFGHLAGGVADLVALKGGTATARVLSGASIQTRGATLEADGTPSPAVSQQLGNHWATYVQAGQAAQNGPIQALRTIADAEFRRQVQLDANLPSDDITSCLTELIRQMRATSDSLNQSTVAVGSQTSVGSPTGNPVFVLSSKNARGDVLQTLFAETIRFAISADAQTGGATARREGFTVKGQAVVSDVFSHSWPGGSGAASGGNLADAKASNTGNNKLYNGSFEAFSTANYPDDWVIAVGAAGTDVLDAGSSDAYTGSHALKLHGDGATLITLRQTFNTAHSTTAGAGGTPATLLPSSQVAVNFWIKALSAAPAAGVLRVALVDGSGTVINDDFGTANSFTVDLTLITTSHVSKTGVFRLGSVLPAVIKLELKTTTAITNTNNVVLDDIALSPMTQLYNGGPSFAGFAGATQTYLNDSWTIATTNTMGAVAQWMERFFSLRDKGLQFPYSGSPTIADSVIA